MDPQAQQEQLEKHLKMEFRDHLVRPDYKDLVVQQELLVQLASQVKQDRKEVLEKLVIRDREVLQDQLALLGMREHKVHLDHRALTAKLVKTELME